MKSFIQKSNKQKGFMMVEIIIAASIILILTLSTMSAVQKGITISHRSLHSTQAAYLLEEGAEAVRIYRDSGWANIPILSTSTTYYIILSGNTWTFSTTPNKVGNFTRTITLSTVYRDGTTGRIVATGGSADAGTRLITVNVSWLESGTTITKSLSFYISNVFP